MIHNSSFFWLGFILVSIVCLMIQLCDEFTCSYLWNGMLIGQTWCLKHHRNGGKRSQRWGNIHTAWHTWPRPYPTTHQYKKTKKQQKTCFCLYKVLSVQTVRAVSFLEMAQRDRVCQGGAGCGCSSTASYVWILWCECHDPCSVLYLLEGSSGQYSWDHYHTIDRKVFFKNVNTEFNILVSECENHIKHYFFPPLHIPIWKLSIKDILSGP